MKALLIIGFPVLLWMSSCTSQLYVSNAVNAPLLKESGEVKITVTPNDVQAAVAVSEHVGVMMNGFYKSYNGDNSYKHSGGMGELGLGYFRTLENNLIFETYGGIGLGRIYKQQMLTDSSGNENLASFDANAGRIFIQPGIGVATRFFDLALTPRFSFVKYTSFRASDYPEEELEKDYLDNSRLTKPLYIFAEPAITLRGGYKFLKLQFQYGLTLNATGDQIKHAQDFSSLGVVIDIAQWHKHNE